MDKETADKVRGMVRRVTLKNVKDDGETQTASVEVADGIWRDDVEISQPYGFASHVPEDGALAMVFAVGGDEGDLVVMPIGNPSKRMGGLKSGEVGMYNEHGDKAVMTAGGSFDIKTGANVTIKTDAGVFITCVVVAVTGDITATGDISDRNGSMQEIRDTYNSHGHPEAPSPPAPLMD
jgi:phage baseplate assembly protein V